MDMNYNDEDLKAERLRDYMYPNPSGTEVTHRICPHCGESLYDGDSYYPLLGLCEYCIPDYKERVEIDED